MPLASVSAIALGAAALVKKLAVQEGHIFFPRVVPEQGNQYHATDDYTGNFVKDVPRYRD